MFYISTRNNSENIISSKAIINGISNEGGLYTPLELPKIDITKTSLFNLNYNELALLIMREFLTDFDEKTLEACITKAYDSKFNNELIAPITSHGSTHFLELYHGPTAAFKDLALSILPHLLNAATSEQKIDKKFVILTATSGDTGKAALEGFANTPNTEVIVFYPLNGVSEIQRRQMETQEGSNVHVIGIRGNFDDAQKGVKAIFTDTDFVNKLNKKNYLLTSANSINIGRLIPQIVYYFYAYLTLVKDNKILLGAEVNISVPTGNFGNILAAYYSKKIGLPINKLICASNENNVLFEFFKDGRYNINRKLKLTVSPSMDILVSSNLERLLFEISDHDENMIKALMQNLKNNYEYEIPSQMLDGLKDFYSNYSTEEDVYDTIKALFKDTKYLIDTHTAVAYSAYLKYKNETNDENTTIIVSTANPFKFGRSICKALDISIDSLNDFEANKVLSRYTGTNIPNCLKSLIDKKILHNSSCEISEMKAVVEEILK